MYPKEFRQYFPFGTSYFIAETEINICSNSSAIAKKRFQFPSPKSEKVPAYVDTRSEREIVANIIRILLCLWSLIVNRDLPVPLTVDSELRMPKQYLDKLVKEMKISQKEKEKMKDAI